MKKILFVLFLIFVSLTITSCKKDEKTIVVGATASPHGEILQFAKKYVEEKGYKLEIKIFEDYTTPNLSLDDGSIDVNYFQHLPYLNSFNKANRAKLVSVAKIHYEPLALYGKNVSSLENAGKTIIIPNDDSNGSRALLLLAEKNLITLKENVNLNGSITIYDVVDFKGYTIEQADASLIPNLFLNADNGLLCVINGNYALEASISIDTALIQESSNGHSANTYANILACKDEDKNSEKIQILVEVLTSEVVKNYISSTYKGAVLPL